MPSTFTTSLRLEKQGTGENNNTWGQRLNTVIDLLDAAVAGHVLVSVSSGTVVLTAANSATDQARNKMLEFTGTLTGNVTVQVPAVSKEYIIWDSTTRGAYSLTLRLGAAGNTLEIPASAVGKAYSVTTDGTDWRVMGVDPASTTAPGVVELATNTETQTGTDVTRAVTPAGLASLTSSTSRRGLVELATDTETQTGTDVTRAVTPAGLASLTATDARRGLVELATGAETVTGTDAARAVTPAGLSTLTANTSRAGLVEFADDTEALAATSNDRAMTPARVKLYHESVVGTAAAEDMAEDGGIVPSFQYSRVSVGGDFNAGSFVDICRVGNMVTVSTVGQLEHALGSTAFATGIVPLWARPEGDVRTICLFSSSKTSTIRITPSGALYMTYARGDTGAAVDANNTGGEVSISYCTV